MKCADCDHKYCEFCNAGDKYHKKAKSNAVTNFDRIKAMSVEEMAEFILSIQSMDGTEIKVDGVRMFVSDIIEYLESEVQEDD